VSGAQWGVIRGKVDAFGGYGGVGEIEFSLDSHGFDEIDGSSATVFDRELEPGIIASKLESLAREVGDPH
jgi:hypothetical protein